MTIGNVIFDLSVLSLFLLAGVAVRGIVKPLQKLFIPASFIGGALLLALGPQGFNLMALPKSTGQYSGTLVDIVLTCLVWGVTINGKKVASYLDYCCVGIGQKGMQLAVGTALGAALCAFWPTLPKEWGTMAVFSFVGGHGTAAAVGGIYAKMGIENAAGLGVVLSTIGLIAAICGGLIIINIGARMGWTKYVSAEQVAKRVAESGGSVELPEDKREPIGYSRVSNDGINNLLFQLAMVLAVLWFGGRIFKLLGAYVHPFFGTLPSILNGIFGAIIIWPIMKALHLDGLVDRRTVSNISGLCLDIVVLSAVGTMKLSLVTEYFVPIMILSVAMIGLTLLMDIWYLRKCARVDWFEKAMLLYGMGTGTAATGIALVRAMDPDSQSTAVEAQAVHNGSSELLSSYWPAAVPLLAVKSLWSVIGLGAIYAIAALVIGWFILRPGVKKLGEGR